jgi:anti-sigma regulatory factor (Ser/Thr protein kinase)
MSTRPVEPTLVLPADHEALRRLGPWLSDLIGLPRADDAPDLLSRIELALHETCTNVVDHAYDGGPGQLSVTGWVNDTTVWVRVTDHGRPFERNAVAAPQPGVPQIRGYGLMIVEQLVDAVDYRRTADTNVCELRIARRATTRVE